MCGSNRNSFERRGLGFRAKAEAFRCLVATNNKVTNEQNVWQVRICRAANVNKSCSG